MKYVIVVSWPPSAKLTMGFSILKVYKNRDEK